MGLLLLPRSVVFQRFRTMWLLQRNLWRVVSWYRRLVRSPTGQRYSIRTWNTTSSRGVVSGQLERVVDADQGSRHFGGSDLILHKSLSKANSAERFVILAAQSLAGDLAVQDCYKASLAATSDLFVDMPDCRVHRSRLEWGRSGGELFIIVRVSTVNPVHLRTYRWRCRLSGDVVPRSVSYLAPG